MMDIPFSEVKPYIDRLVAAEAKVKNVERAYRSLKEQFMRGKRARDVLLAYFMAMDFILEKESIK